MAALFKEAPPLPVRRTPGGCLDVAPAGTSQVSCHLRFKKTGKSDMYDARIPRSPYSQSALFEYLQHRNVVRQNLSRQLLESDVTGNCREMAHEGCSDALFLVAVDNHESHLGLARFDKDVAAPTDDDAPTILLKLGHQGNMADEVYIHEVGDLVLSEVPLGREEAAIQGLGAALAYG